MRRVLAVIVASVALFSGLLAPPAGATIGVSSWHQQPVTDISAVNGVSCPDSNHCWAVGFSGDVLDYHAAILATDDRGVTWVAQPAPAPASFSQLNAVACPDVMHCVAVGWTYVSGGVSASLIVATSDGGATWLAQSGPAGNTVLNAVACASDEACWVAGSRTTAGTSTAVIAATTNGGGTWTPQTPPAGETDLKGVSCGDPLHCWAVGTTSSIAA